MLTLDGFTALDKETGQPADLAALRPELQRPVVVKGNVIDSTGGRINNI